ncbi:MAG: hypothetical protein ACTSYQ_02950, partial [Candidatus Odinarchaeia archaeon]
YHSRLGNQLGDPFNINHLKSGESMEVFLTSLYSLTRYYVDVRVSFEYKGNLHQHRISSEFFLP